MRLISRRLISRQLALSPCGPFLKHLFSLLLLPVQMIFLNAIFGYLCILIIVKWFTQSLATQHYPDLYNVLIR